MFLVTDAQSQCWAFYRGRNMLSYCEAATRTQLIITTHSSALVDAFSEDPDPMIAADW